MKLKYGAVMVVLMFLCVGSCYAKDAELYKEKGTAVYSVPGKSVDQITAGKKAVENIVSVKNSVQEINSAVLQEQLDKERSEGSLVKGKAGEHAPLVEYEDSKIVSLTIFTDKGNPAEQYIFDDGALVECREYDIKKGNKKDKYAPLVEYEDGEIVSLTIFGNKGQPAEKYVFDHGMLVETTIYGKGKVKDVPINTGLNTALELASPINTIDLHKFPQIDHVDNAANAAISLEVTVTEIEENTDVAAKNNAKVKAQEANSRMTRQRINEKRKDMIKALEGLEDKENK